MSEHSDVPPPPRPGAAGADPSSRTPRLRLGAIVALAVAAGVVAWVLVGRGGSSSPSPTTASPTQTIAGPVAKAILPVAVSASGLRTLAGSVTQPIYWAGPKRGYTYELTRTTAGRVFVRYLPKGVKAGAPGANYLIVATYPFPNALNALKAVSGGAQVAVSGGGIAVVDQAYPKSVHLGFPGVAYQVEVYDPSPAVARSVAVSGDVRTVR